MLFWVLWAHITNPRRENTQFLLKPIKAPSKINMVWPNMHSLHLESGTLVFTYFNLCVSVHVMEDATVYGGRKGPVHCAHGLSHGHRCQQNTHARFVQLTTVSRVNVDNSTARRLEQECMKQARHRPDEGNDHRPPFAQRLEGNAKSFSGSLVL